MNLTALKSHLSRLAPILHTRTPLPVLSCVKLSSEAGFLAIEASNLDQAMKITMPYDGPALSCCVGLKRLMSVPGEGEVDVLHSAKLSIKGTGFSATLETLPPDEFPVTPTLEGKELTLEADFGEALKWVAKAVSGESSDPLQTSICFNNLGIVGCDKKRLHIVSFPNLGGVIVPGDCVKSLAEMMDEGAVLRWDERALSVELGDTLYITRQIAGTYMNVKPAIPELTETGWDIDASILTKLIASLPASQSAPWIDVVSDGNHLAVKTRDAGNEIDVEMPCSAVGAFKCSQQGLHDMLSGFKGEQKLEVLEVLAGKGTFHRMCIRNPQRIGMLSGMAQ